MVESMKRVGRNEARRLTGGHVRIDDLDEHVRPVDHEPVRMSRPGVGVGVVTVFVVGALVVLAVMLLIATQVLG
jgi:cell division ATPase FtsA